MRFHGKLTAWNDDRGFGFIAPVPDGDPIFVHIKAFKARNGRPADGQMFSFEVEIGPQGKKRATSVEALRGASRRRVPSQTTGRIDGRPFLAIAVFVAVYGMVALTVRVPSWVAGFYAVTSSVCALVYWLDKSAAEHRRRRIPEATLIGLGLVGGWPGAIVAQQVLRHKTSKASFQSRFWFSVVVNVLAFAGLHAVGFERLAALGV